MSNVKNHTPKDKVWINAEGESVPVKFVPAEDKLKEAYAMKIHKVALGVEASLAALYLIMNDATQAIVAKVKEQFEIKQKKYKGNITWYNFNRSIKVEAEMNDIVKWDEALMTEALSLLNQYLDSHLSDTDVLVKDLINKAFSNTKGMIDTGKVMQLLKYEERIRSEKFKKACSLIRQAQSIDKTKLYMRIWEKQTDGSYRNINLNFSSL